MSHCLRCGEQVPEGTCTCPRPVLVPSLAPEALVARVQELRAEIAEMDKRIERAADEWEREIYLREKREDLVEELCTVATSFIDALEEAGPTVYAKYRRLHAPEGPEALAARMDQIRAEVARLSAEAKALYDRAWDVENGPALGSDEYTAIMDEWHTVMQERFALLAKLTVVRDQYRQALEEPAP